METLSLKRDSWHYAIATMFGWEENKRVRQGSDIYGYYNYVVLPNDFCSYVRRILFGITSILTLVIIGLISATAILTGEYYFFYFVYWYYICGLNIEINPVAGIAIIINAAVLGVFIALSIQTGRLRVFAIPDWLKKTYSWCFGWMSIPKMKIPTCEQIPLCEDTKRFLIATYTMVHDKVCFQLSFHNDDNTNNG